MERTTRRTKHDAGSARMGRRRPDSRYTISPSHYPTRIAPLEYPGHFVVKAITTASTFRFGRRLGSLANALTSQRIGMEETDDGLWSIYFHAVLLAMFHERDDIIQGEHECRLCCRTRVLPMFLIIHCSLGTHAIVSGVVLQLAQAESLHERRYIDPKSAA